MSIKGKNGSYLNNCIIVGRPIDGAIFQDDRINTDVTCMLNGYAIIPIEDYYELKGEPIPDGLAESIFDTRKALKTTDSTINKDSIENFDTSSVINWCDPSMGGPL
jgi:hypothetical protein